MVPCSAMFISLTLIYSSYANIPKPKRDCPTNMVGTCIGPYYFDSGGVNLNKETELTLTWVQANDTRELANFRSYTDVKDHGQCISDNVIYQVFSQETSLDLNPKL